MHDSFLRHGSVLEGFQGLEATYGQTNILYVGLSFLSLNVLLFMAI
jgi:hypothetical protein